MNYEIPHEIIEKRLRELDQDAKKSGYYLNPDMSYTRGLVEGLVINAHRYGYESCPCRLARGDKQLDLDIICPCDYRDDDLSEYGACYCGLYVSESIATKNLPTPLVPERRSSVADQEKKNIISGLSSSLPFPIFRCKVCGYLCARNTPPEKCPICTAGKERFEIFLQ
jgi:ferredoxin-thioredoxin reductase catalytic subunit